MGGGKEGLKKYREKKKTGKTVSQSNGLSFSFFLPPPSSKKGQVFLKFTYIYIYKDR